MDIERVGPGQYRVGTHWVDLEASDAAGKCDCGDYLWKGHDCKHIQEATQHDMVGTRFLELLAIMKETL